MIRNIVPATQQRIEVLIAKIRPLLNIQNILAVMLILFFAGINIVSVLREFSLTTDEDKHYLYGENILADDSTRFDDSKMPVTALNGLPKKLGALTGNERIADITSRFYVARMVTILFSCLVALLVFFWSNQLYGIVPAIFSLSLYVFDPNIIAHSQLVTTDVYVTGMFLLSFYWLWKFANERNLKNGFFVCWHLL